MKKSVAFCFCLSLLLFLPPAFAEVKATLAEGIGQYQQENYEEAIEILTEVRRQQPASTEAAFFLGMAYKQVLDYPNAAVHFQDAVTLTPPIKEALIEYIDILYQLDRLPEAKKWLATAEEVGVSPPRTAFLKGLVYAKENNFPAAIAAFEKAEQLDPALTQVCSFQISMALIKDRKLDKARTRLQAVIVHDPLSDLASFARQYLTMADERLYLEKPLHLTLSVISGYDSNIVLKPLDSAVAGGITDEQGLVLTSSARLDYTPRLNGPWLFNAQYNAASTVNSVHTHSHDSFANSIAVSPGYNFGNMALNLNASYTNVLLRTDPDLAPSPDSTPGYKPYLDYTSIGPALRLFLNQTNILEVFFGYDTKKYSNQKITSPDSIRDSTGMRDYVSWIWLFREDAFLNLRYDFANERADGSQWTNSSHRLTANLSLGILSVEQAKRFGPLNLQLTGSAFFQKYLNEYDYGTFKETRRDEAYTGSIGLAWKFWKYATLIGQYTRTQNNSNVAIYEYKRDQYSAGFEFRY